MAQEEEEDLQLPQGGPMMIDAVAVQRRIHRITLIQERNTTMARIHLLHKAIIVAALHRRRTLMIVVVDLRHHKDTASDDMMIDVAEGSTAVATATDEDHLLFRPLLVTITANAQRPMGGRTSVPVRSASG